MVMSLKVIMMIIKTTMINKYLENTPVKNSISVYFHGNIYITSITRISPDWPYYLQRLKRVIRCTSHMCLFYQLLQFALPILEGGVYMRVQFRLQATGLVVVKHKPCSDNNPWSYKRTIFSCMSLIFFNCFWVIEQGILITHATSTMKYKSPDF